VKVKDPYQDNWERRRDKKQSECSHHHWTKKCSTCNFIFEDEKTHEETKPVEILIAD